MRLSKIKLAGFKSFVDPTTLPLPSNLMGVVGPNGCGKSNVIDAVRWVMGESSAKNLRGESMADVIFNGSSSRKPIGQAAIELIFDNSDGTLGGQYSQFSEISVKRSVSRDGQSNYYLNGARCRRRDITEIFLGTGLGPRSYSIIEQGMISRLIEARPEDLRVFLEEAAGISKYKERRRETENRMQHTRENLNRLNDLRDELDKQLSHLQRQARTAERFKEYKQQQRLLQAQFYALQWQRLDVEAHEREQIIRAAELALEAEVTRQRSLEAELEQLRARQIESGDHFNQVQGRYYEVGAEIARVEQSIQHGKERRQQMQHDLNQLERAWHDAQNHIDTDQRRQDDSRAELMELEPALALAEQAQEMSLAWLAEAEQGMHDWQVQWDDFNHRAAQPTQAAQVERARLQHMEESERQHQQRLLRLEEELAGLDTEALEMELQQFTEQQAALEFEQTELQQLLATSQHAIQREREGQSQLGSQLDATRNRIQSLRGRHASLEALQQAALGKRQGAVNDWLRGQGLEQSPRLAQGLSVEGGWERAVECVLGQYLEAVCVSGLDPVAATLGGLNKGSVTLFDMQASDSCHAPSGDTLLSKVTSSWNVNSLLTGVYVAADLASALARRPSLAPHESVITPEGIWLGCHWLRVARDSDEKSGVLAREQELKQILAELTLLEEQASELLVKQDEARLQLRRLEEERDGRQRDLNQLNRQQADLRGQISGRQARLEQRVSRNERVRQELIELRQLQEEQLMEYEATRQRLHQALEETEILSAQREELNTHRDALREAVQRAREQVRLDREQTHQQALRIQSLRSSLTSTEQALERARSQLELLAERRETMQQQLLEGDEPVLVLQMELEGWLERRMEVEQELIEARQRVDENETRLRELSSGRHGIEQDIERKRTELEQIRMACQELRVRCQTMLEKLSEYDFTLLELINTMPAEASEAEWQKQLLDLGQRIDRLGPINLAAIDEYQEQSKRKEYLDTQYTDLTSALEILEDAIRKIDRETRSRFKETFDKVNSGLQRLFPRLFGGGHAYLELTGEDLLETGVTVMARPPGKRNSTIHLLSGGEKALTAVALVFSIFELNPAPFCMLDEVDAPLDEANVGRFCSMVKEMSERVQFIFITHNKTTMEMAHHLTGVTMHEPGVSRLVSVDVEEAYQMATA